MPPLQAAFAFFQLQAGGFAQAQGEADGEDVDDGQLQQARHHRCVAFAVFLCEHVEHAVGQFGQRRTGTGDGDHGGAVGFGGGGHVEQAGGRARFGNHHRHVLIAQHRRRHQLDVQVGIGDGGDAEAEEFVLRVLRDDAGIADAVKLDASRVHQERHGAFQLGFVKKAARAQDGGGSIAEHFFHHGGHVVLRVEFFVDKGHALVAHVGGQSDFEFGQPFETHAAAEADHGGLADARAAGDVGHGRVDKPFGVGQRAFGDFALRARQAGERQADLVQHFIFLCFSLSVYCRFQTASGRLKTGFE